MAGHPKGKRIGEPLIGYRIQMFEYRIRKPQEAISGRGKPDSHPMGNLPGDLPKVVAQGVVGACAGAPSHVGAEDAKTGAVAHLEINPIHGDQVTVAFDEASGPDREAVPVRTTVGGMVVGIHADDLGRFA